MRQREYQMYYMSRFILQREYISRTVVEKNRKIKIICDKTFIFYYYKEKSITKYEL